MRDHIDQKLLVEMMMKCRYSQSDLAERSGVSRTTISKISCYRCYPSLDVAVAIARALKLPDQVLLQIFFRREGDKTKRSA